MSANSERTNPLDAYEMGTGCWAWGDPLAWGYGRDYGESDVRAAFDASLEVGIALFDTAELYGMGKSEALVGQFLRGEAQVQPSQPIYVATKFLPLPWRWTAGQVNAAIKRSLARIGRSHLDLYQIHWNQPPVPLERWVDALADALDEGLIRAAGVSNYNREQTIRAAHTLEQRGHVVTSNQLEYSLIARGIEFDGTMEACRERGIKIIAYSPLGMGLLTGKYTVEKPPPGMRGRKYRDLLPKLPPLIATLNEIAARHDKTSAQVALNWTICKGTLPIPGAKNAQQVRQNAAALGWRMTADEVAALDAASVGLQSK
ncbi:MAG: aldo/keto reductase [Chloroflexota bacterium]|nr:aldo/keto reductase [Chloroflexota bacterium]